MHTRRTQAPPEPHGPLDFPLSPALGSSGPFAPLGAALLGLTLVGLALAPGLWPVDLALLALEGVALTAAWWACERGGEALAVPLLPAHVPFPIEGEIARALAIGAVMAAPHAPEASFLVDGHEHPVKDLALIGRSEDCHIPLDDPSLALYQAAIVPCGGRLSIVGLQAAELSVNGHPVIEAPLEPGDVVQLGHSTLVYYRDQALGAEPPSRTSGPPVARLEGPGATLTLRRSWFYWIGRNAARCDLAIGDPAAADRHALLVVGASGTVTLVDFTSPLGTRINQRRSHFRTLAHGDVLEVGHTLLRFVENAG